jgi:U3 small nucleolar RNA-associated protein 22
MAPVTKRRKLKHQTDSTHGTLSVAHDNPGLDTTDDESPDLEFSDASMPGIAHSGEEDDDDDDVASVGGKEDSIPVIAGRSKLEERRDKKPRPRDDVLENGIYTGEVYKSNLFKLQLDELLSQVRLKYGKKEAPAENAMRTLKTLIEQLPIREAIAVCKAETACGLLLILARYLRLKDCWRVRGS